MTDPAAPDLAIVEKLKRRLPVCPFSAKAPVNELEPSDPCPVCGGYGEDGAKNLCHGADTRIMAEAAQCIEMLAEALCRVRPFVVMQHPPSPEDRTFALDTIDSALAKVRGR